MNEYRVYDYLPEEAKHIREEVFMKEQGFEDEFDQIDEIAKHLVVFYKGEAVATARMYQGEKDTEYVIGRVAVLPEYRKLHLGAKMIERLEEEACILGATKLVLSAQCRVQPFYERQGFVAVGEVYLDEFCEHIHMEKSLLC
ncbi:MAG: GNAT family N-acetyltransferase [bacterium]|nr:GNAT family N-acetyltransferase [bacterium]